jgi:hypothetical protein
MNIGGALSLRVSRPGREADHSPPSNASIKNAWSYTSTLPSVFMVWYFVKDWDNFTFTSYLVLDYLTNAVFFKLKRTLHY